uniref:Protein RFT1 homolog n=1 Tax=Brassica oleracea var. oleracea TaxID=109376 RepID=A0A0D3EH69_BRAOL
MAEWSKAPDSSSGLRERAWVQIPLLTYYHFWSNNSLFDSVQNRIKPENLFLSREGFRRACLRADINSDGLVSEKDVTRLLKVAWVTLPLGIAVTIAACVFVLWWQSLSYSDTYAQSILIHGTFVVVYHCSMRLCSFVLSHSQANQHGERPWSFMDFDKQLSSMCMLFTLQSFRKLILQEGEKLVLVCFLAGDDNQQKKKKLGTCLTEALKLVMLIGLIFMAFGPSYSYSLIRLLYGEKWSDGEASFALQFYCLYIIVLAMNGNLRSIFTCSWNRGNHSCDNHKLHFRKQRSVKNTGVRECLSIESYVSGIMMTDIINQETGGLNTAK